MSSDAFQPVTGMSDIAAPEVALWQRLEAEAREVMRRFHFSEIRTPVVEKRAVFERSLGDGTDVVQKEMYTFTSRDGSEAYALRPEGTAGVMRYVASLGQEGLDARLFYLGPMFRGERPQKGRRRQFHQLGAEAIGPAAPAADAEMIALHVELLRAWGLRDFTVHLNTRGEPADRRAVQQGLAEALTPHVDQLCDDCRRRLQTNVLRVLDCKQEGCKAIAAGLPPVTAFMSEAARAHLAEVERLLRVLDIPYRMNPALVRGLDYYVHTVWEITHPALGAQDALAGGGRYAISFGEKPVEGVGFAAGLERVVMAVEHDGAPAAAVARPVWLVSLGARAFDENLTLLQVLRRHGVACAMDLSGRSMKAQMRAANRAHAAQVVVRGDTELEKGVFALKDMDAGTQLEVDLPELMVRLGAVPRPA